MSNDDPFIRYLRWLKHENAATLAALRRACGQRLSESRNCQWFVSISAELCDFLTATLAAQYSSMQIQGGKHHETYKRHGSIGAAWARYCHMQSIKQKKRELDPAYLYEHRQQALEKGQAPPNVPSMHERFRTLLDAELERDGTGEFAYRLRGLVRMLVAEDIPIDVIQLARDMRCWRAPRRYVQERWAKAFYSPPSGGKSAIATSEEQDETEELETRDQEEDENAD